MIARAGQLTTVSVPWLVEAGGHLSPRANWAVGVRRCRFG